MNKITDLIFRFIGALPYIILFVINVIVGLACLGFAGWIIAWILGIN